MAGTPREERCEHGEVKDWCGFDSCLAARKKMPKHVVRSERGSTYHRSARCTGLREGQEFARYKGLEVHDIVTVSLSDAIGAGLAECAVCFGGGRI